MSAELYDWRTRRSVHVCPLRDLSPTANGRLSANVRRWLIGPDDACEVARRQLRARCSGVAEPTAGPERDYDAVSDGINRLHHSGPHTWGGREQ
jgi:hypothetical protein